MAGEHSGGQSFYDFLIDEPEMMAPAPPGQTRLHEQQPIPSPNRTSRDPPLRQGPTEQQTHHHTIHHPGFERQLPVQSRVESRAHLHLDLDGAQPNLHNVHPLDDVHGAHNFHESPIAPIAPIAHGSRGIQPCQIPSSLGAASFPTSIPPVSTEPMAVDWGVYGASHHDLSINPTPFDFDLPGLMVPATPTAAADDIIGPQGHFPHAPTDATLAFGNELISPSSIQPQRGNYGFAGHWDDALGRKASTSTVATPVGTVRNNPWVEPDDDVQQDSRASSSHPKRVSRSKRQRKDGKKASETSLGGSSSTGGHALSVSEPASPSTASQHSRASIGSKSVSIASTASTSSSRQPKLRSASRTSKNSHSKPHDTPEDRRTRASHNLVEKQYRNRLNAQFESLLNSLPEQIRAGNTGNGDDDESDGNRVSKGEVLEMARRHIQTLEQERIELERKNLELLGSIRRLKESTSEGTPSSTSQRAQLDSDVDVSGNEKTEAEDGQKS